MPATAVIDCQLALSFSERLRRTVFEGPALLWSWRTVENSFGSHGPGLVRERPYDQRFEPLAWLEGDRLSKFYLDVIQANIALVASR